jgi:tRNA threonylcarbamoyladenosine biosynthesis protein TsaE
MKNLQFQIGNIDRLPEIAKEMLHFAAGAKVFALYGQMGAGKTTLIKELCRQLGSNDNFSSPTYSIVNEYLIDGKPEKIYHIDLYRVKSIAEAYDAGIEEYISGRDYCFIEWPEIIGQLLPHPFIKIELSIENNMREIRILVT